MSEGGAKVIIATAGAGGDAAVAGVVLLQRAAAAAATQAEHCKAERKVAGNPKRRTAQLPHHFTFSCSVIIQYNGPKGSL
jgi:hypothetical protein